MKNKVIVFLVLLLLFTATSVYGQVDTILAVQELEAGLRLTGVDTGNIDSIVFRNFVDAGSPSFTVYDTSGLVTEYKVRFKNNILIEGKNPIDPSDDHISFLEFGVNPEVTNDFKSRSIIYHTFGGGGMFFNLRPLPWMSNMNAVEDTNYINGWNRYDRRDNNGGNGIIFNGGTNGLSSPNPDKNKTEFWGTWNTPNVYTAIWSPFQIHYSGRYPGVILGNRHQKVGVNSLFPRRDLDVRGSLIVSDTIYVAGGINLALPNIAASDTADTGNALITASDTLSASTLPELAFDNNTSTFWNSDSSAFPHELTYSFLDTVGVADTLDTTHVIQFNIYKAQGYLRDFQFLGSNDSTVWDTLGSYVHSEVTTGWDYFDVIHDTNGIGYCHYRIKVNDNYGYGFPQDNYAKMAEIEFITTVNTDTAIIVFDDSDNNVYLVINGDSTLLADTVWVTGQLNPLKTDTIGADNSDSIVFTDKVHMDSMLTIDILFDDEAKNSKALSIKNTIFAADSLDSLYGIDVNLTIPTAANMVEVYGIKSVITDISTGSSDSGAAIYAENTVTGGNQYAAYFRGGILVAGNTDGDGIELGGSQSEIKTTDAGSSLVWESGGVNTVQVTGGTKDIWINPYIEGIPDSTLVPNADSHLVSFSPMISNMSDGYTNTYFGLQWTCAPDVITKQNFANHLVVDLPSDFRSFQVDSAVQFFFDMSDSTGDSLSLKIFNASSIDSSGSTDINFGNTKNSWKRAVVTRSDLGSLTFSANDRMVIRFYYFISGGDISKQSRIRLRYNRK